MKKILITGAGGFIGGRLVEVLKDTLNPEVNILLRSIQTAARISRYPLNYYIGSIDDNKAVEEATVGCDVVVHCAHDFAHPDVNLLAADCIAKNCLKNKVKKLIYISSFSVHLSNSSETIQETSPFNEQWDYAINKQQVEKKLLRFFHDSGLPIIILRPTIVYGPFSAAWTTYTVSQMLENRLVVPYEGKRICNAVYIDDVVDAILQAINSPDTCNGKSFIVSGPDVINWKQYYDSFLTYPGLNRPVYLRDKDSDKLDQNLKSKIVKKKVSFLKDPITVLKKTFLYDTYQKLLKKPSLQKKLLNVKSSIPRPLNYPSRDMFDTLSCSSKVDISRLQNELGFQPEITFTDGMNKTLKWIEWANLNCN